MSNFPVDLSSPARFYPLVTKADADLPDGICRGLLVGVAGTATLMDMEGNIEADVPLQQGYNPLICKQVRLGGTADDIRAIY